MATAIASHQYRGFNPPDQQPASSSPMTTSFPLEAEKILSVIAHEPHRPSAWLGAGAAHWRLGRSRDLSPST